MSLRSIGRFFSPVVALACVLGLLAAAGIWLAAQETGQKQVTAYFPQTVGLFEGNTVRVLGVEMGTVEAVVPEGDRVRVDMSYDDDVEVPAEAEAAVVAPSLVSDRYVQLAPAYTGGAELEDDAIIPEERTEIPLEIDELYDSVNRVTEALGPEGANEDGALSDLITTLAENLDGQGEDINETVTTLGRATETLAGSSDELFNTVGNLAEFTTTLAESDDEVQRFEEQLADVSGFLADERENLAATVDQLDVALGQVHDFVEDNRTELQSNVDKLASVTEVLVDQRAELAEFMDVAPTALNNIINAYNASGASLDARPNFNELTMDPLALVCTLIGQLPEPIDGAAQLCEGVTEPLQGVLPSPGEMIETLQDGALPLPTADELPGSAGDGGDQ